MKQLKNKILLNRFYFKFYGNFFNLLLDKIGTATLEVLNWNFPDDARWKSLCLLVFCFVSRKCNVLFFLLPEAKIAITSKQLKV